MKSCRKHLMLALAALLASACGSKTQVSEPQPGGDCPLAEATAPGFGCGFLSRSGVKLMLGGVNYRAAGFNRYELAGGPQTFTSQCQRTPNANTHTAFVDQFMAKAAAQGATVVRFWAFQQYAGANGTDYSAFDKIVAAAHRNGLRVIPVLESNWADCTQPSSLQEKDVNFYSAGYKAPYGYALSLPDYVRGLVTHFKSEPAIAMWEILNEGKLVQAPSTLAAFLDDIAQQIKAIDKNHLVAGGGALQCWQGAQGVADFTAYGKSSAIDVVDQHDYYSTNLAWPGCMEGALQAATVLGKPLIVGEAGISTKASEDNVPVATRATYFDAKLQAAAPKGVQQYLIWSYNADPVYADGYDLLDGDPALSVFQSATKNVFRN